jgi:hypothetical protein
VPPRDGVVCLDTVGVTGSIPVSPTTSRHETAAGDRSRHLALRTSWRCLLLTCCSPRDETTRVDTGRGPTTFTMSYRSSVVLACSIRQGPQPWLRVGGRPSTRGFDSACRRHEISLSGSTGEHWRGWGKSRCASLAARRSGRAHRGMMIGGTRQEERLDLSKALPNECRRTPERRAWLVRGVRDGPWQLCACPGHPWRARGRRLCAPRVASRICARIDFHRSKASWRQLVGTWR